MASSASATGERQMEVGRVFERAIAAVKTNPAVILGLALVVGAIPNVIITYLFAQSGLVSPEAMVSGAVSPAGFFAAVLFSALFSMVIGALVQGALTRAAVSAAEGRKVSFGDSLATGLRVILPLIGLAIISGAGVALGMLLLIVPGVILALMWSVAVPVLVTERRGVFESLGRSNELTRGAKGRILGIFVVVFIAYGIASMVMGVVGLAGFNAGTAQQGLTVANLLGSVVLGTLLNAAWGTIQPALYVELRQWKEGTSVEALEDVFA